MINLEWVKNKRWRTLIESIGRGDEVQFVVEDTKDVDSIRTVASRVNSISPDRSYTYAVNANGTKVQIYTRAKL